MDSNTNYRTDLSAFSEKITALRQSVNSIVVGQSEAVDMLITSIIADGHVLLEGVPGVAKTLMARLMAKLIDARFCRLQFTPDLMPSDVLGTTVFNMKNSEFDFHPGPVFSDIVLVDEINRAPAKTQAALFEVMEEHQATIDGVTHSMGELFTVIATQNPVEQEGTYKLPEAQLDRFLMKVVIGYPSPEEEVHILQLHQQKADLVQLSDVKPLLSKQELIAFRQLMHHIVVDEVMLQYITQLVQLTRSNKAVFLGASPRASVAILKASKAYAMMNGRDFVVPDDVKAVAPSILRHRIILTVEAEMEGYRQTNVVKEILEAVEVPK